MFSDLSENERRELARRSLDAAEAWLRKVIHQQLSQVHGEGYFDARLPNGNPVIPKKIRHQAKVRIEREPKRFERPIDAVSFGDAVKIVLHPDHYQTRFREALDRAYPDGAAEARTFLDRLEGHRNKSAHQGTCSLRDLEQCVCYSNDLIQSLAAFFAAKNMQRLYNVPMITRVVDNRGNELHPPLEGRKHIVWNVRGANGDLRVGDTLAIEIEVDESFPNDSYQVRWRTHVGDAAQGLQFTFPIEIRHVREQFIVVAEVVSNKPWHRLGNIDDKLFATYRVLPPE